MKADADQQYNVYKSTSLITITTHLHLDEFHSLLLLLFGILRAMVSFSFDFSTHYEKNVLSEKIQKIEILKLLNVYKNKSLFLIKKASHNKQIQNLKLSQRHINFDKKMFSYQIQPAA